MSFLDLIQTTTASALEETVVFTQRRHGVLAGNVANLDTPGYTARDLSPAVFEARLREAIEADRAPASTQAPWAGELTSGDALSRAFLAQVEALGEGRVTPGDPSLRPDPSDASSAGPSIRSLAAGGLSRSKDAGDPIRQVRDMAPTILRHDGNDLSIEQQVTAMSKNESLHNLAIGLLRSQFAMLRAAISEDPSG